MAASANAINVLRPVEGPSVLRVEPSEPIRKTVRGFTERATTWSPAGMIQRETPSALADTHSPKRLRERFGQLARAWLAETRHFSSLTSKCANPNYLRILAMERRFVVPLLLEALDTMPGDWFPALWILTDAQPVPKEDAGDYDAMKRAWLRWGRENGYT